MSETSKVVHKARTRTTGGRERGISRSSDGRLDIRLAVPAHRHQPGAPVRRCVVGLLRNGDRVGGPAEENHSACRRCDRRGVDLNVTDGGCLSARFNISLPGVERAAAHGLIDEAHRACPYSEATRGNMEVAMSLIE